MKLCASLLSHMNEQIVSSFMGKKLRCCVDQFTIMYTDITEHSLHITVALYRAAYGFFEDESAALVTSAIGP